MENARDFEYKCVILEDKLKKFNTALDKTFFKVNYFFSQNFQSENIFYVDNQG